MKKLISAFSVLMLLSTTVLASATSVEKAPSEPLMLFSFQASQLSDSLKTLIEDLEDSLTEEEQFGYEQIMNKQITFGILGNKEVYDEEWDYTYSESIMYLAFEATKEEFDSVLEFAVPTEERVNKRHQDQDYYFSSSDWADMFVTYLNGQFVMTNTEESLIEVLDNREYFESKEFFKSSEKYVDPDTLFYMYMDYANFMELMLSEQDRLELTEIGFTQPFTEFASNLTQTDFGFTGNSYFEVPPELQKELTEKELTKYLPKGDNILIVNGQNYYKIQDVMSDILAQDLDLDLETLGLKELFFGINEIAFSVQNNKKLIPDFTLLVKYSNVEMAQNEFNLLENFAWTAMASEADRVLKGGNELVYDEYDGSQFSVEKSYGNLQKLATWTFKYTYPETKNPYIKTLPEELRTLSITAGITEEGHLLFSNVENLSEKYGQGNSQLEGTTLLWDFDETHDYFKNAIEIIEEVNDEDFSAEKQILGGFMQPWEKLTVNADTSMYPGIHESMELHMDLDTMIESYPLLAMQAAILESNMNDSLDAVFAPSFTKMSDIDEKESWYQDDVYYLSANGIVNGYSDGTFKPANSVTRAEFIKMIVETMIKKGYLSESDLWYSFSEMTDIDYSDWYFDYVATAETIGLVNGYADNTFRPNNNVSRAEAAKIMNNVAEYIMMEKTMDELTFEDIASDDWYYEVVKDSTSYGMMSGYEDGTFKPKADINRAEAAKMIRTLMEKL